MCNKNCGCGCSTKTEYLNIEDNLSSQPLCDRLCDDCIRRGGKCRKDGKKCYCTKQGLRKQKKVFVNFEPMNPVFFDIPTTIEYGVTGLEGPKPKKFVSLLDGAKFDSQFFR